MHYPELSPGPRPPIPPVDGGGVSARRRVRREVFELGKMVLVSLLIFMGLKTYVIEGYEVQGPSMAPALEDSERILVFKLPHKLSQWRLFGGFEAIGEQDIVVFESAVESNKRYIKRVVARGPARPRGKIVDASPRDAEADAVRVEYRNGALFVENRLINEAYLRAEDLRSRDRHVTLLRAGEYYVLGDHRSVSKDSRSFNAINEDQIIGKAVLRFWPLNKFGLL